jgi:hypothetical protein
MNTHGTRSGLLKRSVWMLALLLGAAVPTTALIRSGEAFAQANEQWHVRGRLLGKPRFSIQDDIEKAKDVSGIACATDSGYPRLCIVADDEAQGVQIVILRERDLKAGDFIPLISDSFGEKPLELDAEAVAFSDGAFYVIGSHGRPRHNDTDPERKRSEAQAAASQRVFRIRIARGAADMATGTLIGTYEITSSRALSEIIKTSSRRGCGPLQDEHRLCARTPAGDWSDSW